MKVGVIGVVIFLAFINVSSAFGADSITSSPASPMRVTYVDASDLKKNPSNAYFGELLKLAMDKSVARFGPYQLNSVALDISQKRQQRELEKGTIDVFWTMTSHAREVDMRPIYFPLTKGMYGIRLFAINQRDSEAFRAINSVESLAKWPAIQGYDWPDTAILRVNRLDVRTEGNENEFYGMLSKRSGFYYPRAVIEIFPELESRPELDIMVDNHIGIIYPTAVYFFVAKNNIALAERLFYGLTQAREDGSFDELFYQYPTHQQAFEQANFSKRKWFFLENPLLPESFGSKEIMDMQKEIIQKYSGKD